MEWKDAPNPAHTAAIARRRPSKGSKAKIHDHPNPPHAASGCTGAYGTPPDASKRVGSMEGLQVVHEPVTPDRTAFLAHRARRPDPRCPPCNPKQNEHEFPEFCTERHTGERIQCCPLCKPANSPQKTPWWTMPHCEPFFTVPTAR